MDFYSVDKWESVGQCKNDTIPSIFYGKSSSTIRNKLNRETEKHVWAEGRGGRNYLGGISRVKAKETLKWHNICKSHEETGFQKHYKNTTETSWQLPRVAKPGASGT